MTTSSTSPLSFGENYAVLNLDWMTVLIDAVKDTPEGHVFIQSCNKWNAAIHQKSPRPLTVFSTLSFQRGQPEVQPNTPFANLIAPYGEFGTGSSEVRIAEYFKLDEQDIILQKTRWSATMGSSLEQILQARNIRTVIMSGLSLSGVVMATIYRLFDLDYDVYVIRDNVLELPVDQTAAFSSVMLDMLLPKMGLKVISLDEALQALERS
ncbi:cysteine hydrolase family protein [Aspergillus brunneoviolaceus CBS 621.78]|uniref:Cysteine hydrolase family protein n=1 Tax=Aspergillus brunneoviolaceus CBS 621.78 TaxID=1450534 RepID=A0ACD1GN73_9EURO|nr:cysteine hydrolase family protein [Aspergillus brunneoviolaceus CBS 621.78]RAH50657.1 cysteine hydrolase family protein [Aspergillus brunneoviolaceus CBS 621.78]